MSEDAVTFKQTSGTSYVNGGGARNADDKVLQRNGGETVAIQNFFVSYIENSEGSRSTRNENADRKIDGPKT
jgi:Pectate lyase